MAVESTSALRRPRAWAALVRSTTVRDAAWAAVVALLLALSPVTGAKRVIPSLVLGACGGGIALVDRLRRRAVEGPRPRRAAIAMPTGPVWAVLVCALAVFSPVLVWLYREYTESIWADPQGLFVAFFVVLLVRHRLRDDPDPTPQASAWGFALLLPGCALAVLDAGIRSHYIGLLGLLLALPGLALLLLGTRRTRRLAFPLALCLFLIPVPDGLGNPLDLPTLTSAIGAAIAQAAGMPVALVDTRLELANGVGIEVAQNCSGLSYFYGGCAFAFLCLGVTRSWPRRLALVAAPYGLAALGNGLRIALLVLVGGSVGLEWKLTTPFHGMVGSGIFLSVMAGIWLLSDRRALREELS
jgi:exosortase